MNKVEDNTKALMASVDGLNDLQLLWLATFAVGRVGARAQDRGDVDVEEACARYVKSMSIHAGTPVLQEQRLQ